MTDNPDDEIPPRVEDCEIGIVSFDPLIGVMQITTDKGEIELAINRNAATILAMTLVDFLGSDARDAEEASELN